MSMEASVKAHGELICRSFERSPLPGPQRHVKNNSPKPNAFQKRPHETVLVCVVWGTRW